MDVEKYFQIHLQYFVKTDKTIFRKNIRLDELNIIFFLLRFTKSCRGCEEVGGGDR